MNTLGRILLRAIAVIFIFLVILEVALQLAGFIYTRWIYRPAPQQQMVSDTARNILFIGDSWTQGADAVPEPGFSSRTVKKLNEHFPDRTYRECNYAWGGANSSQAVLQFFDHYNEVKPKIVIVLTGANNAWNTQDVAAARRRLAKALEGNEQAEKITLGERLINTGKKLKLVKLYLLIKQYLVTSHELETEDFKNEFSQGYFNTFVDSGSGETARDYLLENYRENEHDYYDLFRLLLHSFDGDIDKTVAWLEENNLWYPEKLKGKFDIEENRRYHERGVEILEEQLAGLKQFCDAEGVVMIVQNYPHQHPGIQYLNSLIGKMAEKLAIVYVDQARYFTETVGLEEWSRVLTQGHVNAQGHEYMAENLFSVLSDLIETGENKE